MIPKIIHQTAKTKAISWEERRLVDRMKRKLPDWKYMFHDDNDNEQLVKKYFPNFLEKYRAIPRGVAKADISRLIYMYVYGGFYFDTDYKLYQEIPEWMLEKKQLLMESREDPSEYKLGNAILASEPGGSFYKGFIEHIFESDELNHLKENRVELVTGPEALTNYYMQHKDLYENCVSIIPRMYFHTPSTCHGLIIKREKESIGAHLCWGSWRSGSLVKRIFIFIQRKIQAF
jgi:mannosyltransferase OCH1-like enzyme